MLLSRIGAPYPGQVLELIGRCLLYGAHAGEELGELDRGAGCWLEAFAETWRAWRRSFPGLKNLILRCYWCEAEVDCYFNGVTTAPLGESYFFHLFDPNCR